MHTKTSSRPYRTSFWVALGWPIGNLLESNRTSNLRTWSRIANNLAQAQDQDEVYLQLDVAKLE